VQQLTGANMFYNPDNNIQQKPAAYRIIRHF